MCSGSTLIWTASKTTFVDLGAEIGRQSYPQFFVKEVDSFLIRCNAIHPLSLTIPKKGSVAQKDPCH